MHTVNISLHRGHLILQFLRLWATKSLLAPLDCWCFSSYTCILMCSPNMFKKGMGLANPKTKRLVNHQSCCSAARFRFLSQLLPVLVAGFPRKQPIWAQRRSAHNLCLWVCVRVCLSFLPTLNNFLICWSIGWSDLTEGKSLQERL